ncbi:hypothetical protein RvY_15924 [Ramazzottius varieornatus]|uniref:Uncharacterized protein n=1 Tax=Ramazzottius varieornatus TaxID=947166 RepID=A0A1D1W4G2_RAMVA|nr:hypothetical protein RvY_15924 [Ramazzottius varieornatus]
MAKQAEEGETESLLSVTDKDDNKSGLRKARTKEEEHQVILEAMQKRFVCPNFAVPAPRAVSSITLMDNGFDQRGQGKKVAAGHMKMLPVESANEVDQLIARLDDAFQTHKPPFDTWDNLLDKFSDIQRKQLVLNYANLELAWTKNSGGRDGESGVTFRQHLTTFQEMLDDLSKDILVLQAINHLDSSDTLPRRRGSSDQPDLEALHAKLFQSVGSSASKEPSSSFYLSTDANSSDMETVGKLRFPSSAESLTGPSNGATDNANRSSRIVPTAPMMVTPSQPGTKISASEPPSYPPPPLTKVPADAKFPA